MREKTAILMWVCWRNKGCSEKVIKEMKVETESGNTKQKKGR